MRTALIVGAGIGGLAAGLALLRAGWHVRIFERASAPRELGFALGLAPNAVAALRELGLAETVLADAVVPRVGEVRRGDGQVLKRIDLIPSTDVREVMAVALRPVVHGALLDAVGLDALVLGSEAVSFETTPSDVELTLRDGRRATADVLIGADGVGSVIRRILRPNDPPPRPSGYYAFRGVAYGVNNSLGDCSAIFNLGDGIEAATVSASRNGIYWYLSILADAVVRDLEPARILERCLHEIAEPFGSIVRATTPDDVRFEQLFDRDPIDDWGAGRATLLGDAAHPMLPHTGQGAAQALEDAVALGLALARADDPIAALRRYERVRSARTRRVVLLGRRIARVTTTRSRAIAWLRDTAIRIAPARRLVGSFQLRSRADPHLRLR